MRAVHSSLYVGRVAHDRLRPCRHRLSYDVFYLLLDLDEIETLAGASRLFRSGRFGLVSFDSRDHGDGSDVPLLVQVERHLRAAGLMPDGGRTTLLTLPRILGYVFNPISIYFCHRRTGELAAVLYEVTNTFGDRHIYLVAVDSPDRPLRQQSDKALHVSPFLDMDMRYTFRLTPPAERFALAVTTHDHQGPMLVATFEATRRELTDRMLVRALAGYPLMTLKVIAAIHWQALLLWLKGLAVRGRPDPPARPVTIGRSLATARAGKHMQNEHDVAA